MANQIDTLNSDILFEPCGEAYRIILNRFLPEESNPLREEAYTMLKEVGEELGERFANTFKLQTQNKSEFYSSNDSKNIYILKGDLKDNPEIELKLTLEHLYPFKRNCLDSLIQLELKQKEINQDERSLIKRVGYSGVILDVENRNLIEIANKIYNRILETR